jgi:zinc protease
VAVVVLLAACSSRSAVEVVESAATAAGGTDDPIGIDDGVRVGSLDNGLTYYVRENDSPGGTAELRLVVDAGSVLEDPDQAGVAHFLEHMMFNGTAHYPKNELIDVLRGFGAEFGADINAFTTYDETVYELSVPSRDGTVVDTGLDILHQWLSAATLDLTAVDAEIGVVLDEWRGSAGTGGELVADAIERMFFADSAYVGRDPIGDEQSISAMSPDLLRRFYDRWYRPDNAAVVVVGDIDADAIEASIVARFADLAPRGDTPERPVTTVVIATEPRVEVVGAPDITTAQVELTLPGLAEPITSSAALRRTLLDTVATSILSSRLDDDARRGNGPLLGAEPSSNSHVRPLDAPAVLATADVTQLGAAIDAVLLEFERLRRLGVLPNELERAVTELRTIVETAYDGRDSRLDVEFAEQYVEHFLTGTAIPDAETEFRLHLDALDDITAEDVASRLAERTSAAAVHVLVLGPPDAVGGLPTVDALRTAIASLPDLVIDARADVEAAPDELLAPPAPVSELSRESLPTAPDYYIEPVQLTFPNGARVVVNRTDISAGQVALVASSPGGTALLDPADLPDAYAAPDVVATSGIGALDPVQLDLLLADRDVTVVPYLDVNEEGFFGSASTNDLETMFQLLHLMFAAPRFDEGALGLYRSDLEPRVIDPTSNLDDATFNELISARYRDSPHYRYLPSVGELASVDLAGIERVWRTRFADPGDFVFAISGDLDPERAVELARAYIGSLPGDATIESTVDIEPALPTERVERTVVAGEGEGGQIARLYTAPSADEATDEVLAQLASELITSRLTNVVREQFGASYSPFAVVQVTDAPRPSIETFVQVTGDPSRIAELGALVGEQLDDLRAAGATTDELSNARVTIDEQLRFVTNEEINQAVIEPGGIARYAGRQALLASLDDADIVAFLATILAADRYVQVTATPR